MKTYPFAVFIGRFQPFHNGHYHVIAAGLKQAEKIIVLCGSAHLAPTLRNPWSFEERKAMILNSFSQEEAERITVLPLIDSPYNQLAWIESVQTAVNSVVQTEKLNSKKAPKIAFFSQNKAPSYLSSFPQWEAVEIENFAEINGTSLRQQYFGGEENFFRSAEIFNASTPKGTQQFLAEKFNKSVFDEIFAEHQFVQAFKKSWQVAPYPPVFVTVDAVVIQSGHILLVKRKNRPGKGLWALPGGFLDQTEYLQDACIRELREETLLKIPDPLLYGCIKRSHVFDAPYRSARGRTLTHAFLIELPNTGKLPQVKGSDDAEKAFWLPLAEVKPEKMFEDHYFIIRHLQGV
jgi:bifunctional NMN adenylyltransferase/nudix hydrolase